MTWLSRTSNFKMLWTLLSMCGTCCMWLCDVCQMRQGERRKTKKERILNLQNNLEVDRFTRQINCVNMNRTACCCCCYCVWWGCWQQANMDIYLIHWFSMFIVRDHEIRSDWHDDRVSVECSHDEGMNESVGIRKLQSFTNWETELSPFRKWAEVPEMRKFNIDWHYLLKMAECEQCRIWKIQIYIMQYWRLNCVHENIINFCTNSWNATNSKFAQDKSIKQMNWINTINNLLCSL